MAPRAPPTVQPDEAPQLPPHFPMDAFPNVAAGPVYVCRKTMTPTDIGGMKLVGNWAEQFFEGRPQAVQRQILSGITCKVLLADGMLLDCFIKKERNGSMKFSKEGWNDVVYHAGLDVGTSVDCWCFASPTEADLIFAIHTL